MSRFVRQSKYRHVFGQTAKKEHTIENVKVSNSAWDTNLISASAKYISLNWNASGGGAFAILPLPSPFNPAPHSLPHKLPDIIPLARGHTAPVLDTDWSPFDDSVVASGGEDGKILIWKVEPSQFDGWGAERWVPEDFEPVARIDGSARKIGQLLFHPTASNVVAAATGEHVVKLWDLGNTDDARATLTGHTDTIQSLAFNWTGTLIATTCRDRKLRLFDARAGGDPVRITDGHGGIKGARVTWMGDRDCLATTGFSKMSDREVAVWETGGLTNVKKVVLDSSAGVIMPFWSDNGILFLAGKGDGNIRYFEYESDTLHALSEHKSSDPQRGMCFLPRRALSVTDCEIARAYKVYGTTIEPIAFVVPRKADTFQSDIFPPALSSEPALTGPEFFSGKTAQPKLVDLDTGNVSSAPPSSSFVPAPTKSTSAPASLPAHTPPAKKPSMSTLAAPPSATAWGSSSPSLTPSPLASEFRSDAISEENARLTNELREARTQIRNLELQVETMRANAQKAAKALLDNS